MFGLRRQFAALRCYVTLARDPGRLDVVFGLRDALENRVELDRVIGEMKQDPRIAEILRERKRLGRIDMRALSALPAGTLGREFADTMRARGLDPADLPTLEASSERDYLSAHLYETHDIWHVVTGFDNDIAGELGLQAFYAAQIAGPLPFAILSAGLLNTLLFGMDDNAPRMEAIAQGWALGRQAKPFFGVDSSAHWRKPLSEVRASLGITAPIGQLQMQLAA